MAAMLTVGLAGRADAEQAGASGEQLRVACGCGALGQVDINVEHADAQVSAYVLELEEYAVGCNGGSSGQGRDAVQTGSDLVADPGVETHVCRDTAAAECQGD